MGVDISISTRQGTCHAGDVIEGSVHLNVSGVGVPFSNSKFGD